MRILVFFCLRELFDWIEIPQCARFLKANYHIKVYNAHFNYRPQRRWGKVMFLHVCMILFTGQVLSQHALQVVSQHALQQVSRWGAIPACIAGGIPACLAASLQEGGLLLEEGVCSWGGVCPCGVPGPRGVPGGDPTPGMATAADGKHPTGMHSCFWISFNILFSYPENENENELKIKNALLVLLRCTFTMYRPRVYSINQW